uniref:Ovule protein n=1 Tax=Parascaris univalens TaxID=6257 RepID=A0A914ZQQ0_PARUN
MKEASFILEETSKFLDQSDELPSYAFVISAMLFMLIMAEIVMILFAIWIKYIEDKWWEEQTNRPKNNINT